MKYNLSTIQPPQSEAKKQAYKNYARDIYYLLLVGLLLFTTQTQLDIQFVVNFVTQFGNNLGITHLKVAKCILCYFKGTIDLNLVLGRQIKEEFDLVD